MRGRGRLTARGPKVGWGGAVVCEMAGRGRVGEVVGLYEVVRALLEVFRWEDGSWWWWNLLEVEELRWVSGPEDGLARTEVGVRTRRWPVEMGAWPLAEVVLLQHSPHADEEAVLVSGDPLRALWERRACEIECMQIYVHVAVPG